MFNRKYIFKVMLVFGGVTFGITYVNNAYLSFFDPPGSTVLNAKPDVDLANADSTCLKLLINNPI